jgi:hypothetical protein
MGSNPETQSHLVDMQTISLDAFVAVWSENTSVDEWKTPSKV